MQTFEFFLDEKVTTWMRTNFTVEANSMDEAKTIAIEKYKNGELDEFAWEEVADFKERLSIDENGGEPTVEIFDNSDSFYNNAE
jgi:hypothetical protein